MLSGWGRVPLVDARELRSEDLERITRDAPLTRGLGRAYGDAALPASPGTTVAGSALADRILSFDPQTGVLHAEAGLSADRLYRALLPRGWFTPVTPGTRFVTLGGMVAADVHGKNHHRDGCIGEHVLALRVRVADGRIVTCSREQEAELFFATIGGMGLTGHILEVTLRLLRVPSPWIAQETEAVVNVDHFLRALTHAAAAWPMTVGWVDTLAQGAHLGRGILFKGRWAEPHEAPRTFPALRAPLPIPFTAPGGLLRPFTVRLFNRAYYAWHARQRGVSIVHPASFFYPLDALGGWNRLYGPRGFIQYQCVLPTQSVTAAGQNGPALHWLLSLIARKQRASFLCVIKDCGAEGAGLLSFPKPGISIALDMPFGDDTQALVDEMNAAVIAAGGRIYLAKDALTRAEHFRAMEPRLDEFLRVRRRWDPDGRIRSAMSVRLFGW